MVEAEDHDHSHNDARNRPIPARGREVHAASSRTKVKRRRHDQQCSQCEDQGDVGHEFVLRLAFKMSPLCFAVRLRVG